MGGISMLFDKLRRMAYDPDYQRKHQYFADRVYVAYFPNGKVDLFHNIDDDNLPKGTLIAEYRFIHWQDIYEEK